MYLSHLAEGSIRSFCICKDNWYLTDTIDGAKVSAIIYSIVEKAKRNNLKLYNFFEFILT
ncbi:MAG: hypothetical protein KIC67_15275 [Clostridium butyricum]|nr:hypothetical protein [Clostridium butyricum]